MRDPSLVERFPSLPWVAPFAVFMLLLGAMPATGMPQPWESIVRVAVITAAVLVCSSGVLKSLRVEKPLGSIALGLGTFALWVLPDQLFPGWRFHWLFQNEITGTVRQTISSADLASPIVVSLRLVRAVILVPVVEELFWRGWLPRWMDARDWQRVPLGRFTATSFVAVAILFAAEHGPYWEVGLVCGVIYNWWMWKTRSLGDMVLAHGVTNAALSGFVLLTGQYSYWM